MKYFSISFHECFVILIYIYICRGDKPNSAYWDVGPVQEHLVIRRQVNVIAKVHISGCGKGSGHKGLGRRFKDK